ncbi:MAG: hypothetical protein ACF8SC_00075 [Phycisphaerales bacterium JB037]
MATMTNCLHRRRSQPARASATLLSDVARSIAALRPDERGRHFGLRGREATASFEHPGGGKSDRRILISHLTRQSIGLIVAGYLHPTTQCVLALPARDGSEATIRASVDACRFLSGRFHHLELVLEEPLDIRRFVDLTAADAEEVSSSEPLTVSGRLLHISESPVQHLLVGMLLRSVEIEVVPVESIGKACDKLQLESFDAVLCEEAVDGRDVVECVRALRRDGFGGPILGSVFPCDDRRTAEILGAGVAEIVVKPLMCKPLIDALGHAIREQRDPLNSTETIHSTLEPDSIRRDCLIEYINEIRRTRRELQQAITRDDYAAARKLCLSLVGSAASFGLDLVGDAAGPTITALDACCSAQEAAPDLRKLIRVLDRVAMPGENDPPAAQAA